MVTISVPITPKQEKFIKELVKSGRAANKAHAVRYAIQKLSDDEAIESVLRSQKEAREGKTYYGDLRELMKRVK